MTYLNTIGLELGDTIKLRNVLNKEEEWQIVSQPKKNKDLRGNLMECMARRGAVEFKIYFNQK